MEITIPAPEGPKRWDWETSTWVPCTSSKDEQADKDFAKAEQDWIK